MNRVRCAIYTRKSSDEGLDQAFNSLDAQREACEAYIKSQKHEGWKVLPAFYDDGGASGGNLERAALQQLMSDVDAGRVDMIVVYKIDRLTRSLADFAKLVERLEGAGASFVSVTQQFNTSTSMGRLTLNVLLSFAQFEREVTAERIRDKIAASKKKGMWMGGLVPLGYDKRDDGLVINKVEAKTVRALFQAYLEVGCVRKLKEYADRKGLKTKTHIFKSGRTSGGISFSRGRLYHLLANPIYVGRIRHKDQIYDGLHEAIIREELLDKVQARLSDNAATRKSRRNATNPSPLAGKLFDEVGGPLTPSHACKKGKRYRYYVSKVLVQKSGDENKTGWRLPASEIENAVLSAIDQDRDVKLCLQSRGEESLDLSGIFAVVTMIQIHEEHLSIEMDMVALGGSDPKHTILAPYTLRRRGVETRLMLAGDAKREPDLVLIRRIIRATNWLNEIQKGRTFTDIAKDDSITPEYIASNIDLALLSPNIYRAILDGILPPELTSKALTVMQIPIGWQEQDAALLQ